MELATLTYSKLLDARVVELVDTLVLGTSASRREGSSPFSRTKTLLYAKPAKNPSFGGFLALDKVKN